MFLSVDLVADWLWEQVVTLFVNVGICSFLGMLERESYLLIAFRQSSQYWAKKQWVSK